MLCLCLFSCSMLVFPVCFVLFSAGQREEEAGLSNFKLKIAGREIHQNPGFPQMHGFDESLSWPFITIALVLG